MKGRLTEHQITLCAAALNAILDVNRSAADSIIVDPEDCRAALTMALATILEAWPGVDTSRDLRLLVDTVARELLANAKALRGQYERSGKRPWDGALITAN